MSVATNHSHLLLPLCGSLTVYIIVAALFPGVCAIRNSAFHPQPGFTASLRRQKLVVPPGQGELPAPPLHHGKRPPPHFPMCEPWFRCYQFFLANDGSTYHSLCTAWDKLKVCKNVVERAYSIKSLHDTCLVPVADKIADYWCTLPNGSMLFREFSKCPYISAYIIPVYRDFSTKMYLLYGRAQFALNILIGTGMEGLSMWKPGHIYNSTRDPVFRALISAHCDIYNYVQYKAKLVDKYCGGDVHNTFVTVASFEEKYFSNIYEGLQLHDFKACHTRMDDTLLQVKHLSNITAFFQKGLLPNRGQCNSYNVLVRGVSCQMNFHATRSPFTNLHEYLPSMCKGLKHLQTCWGPIVKACPGSNMTNVIDDIVELHHLVCETSTSNLSIVIVNRWADNFKLNSHCQILIQSFEMVIGEFSAMSKAREHVTEVAIGILECMMSSLNTTIIEISSYSYYSGIHDQGNTLNGKFKKLHKIMNTILSVLNGSMGVGLSISDIGLSLLPMIGTVYIWITRLLGFFWVEGGFVSYDPWHPPWW